MKPRRTTHSSNELIDRVRARIVNEGHEPNPQTVAEALRSNEGLVGASTVLSIVERLQRESRDAGALQHLLDLPNVSDVLVNGTDSVWIDAGHGLVRQASIFSDEIEVRRLAQRLASIAGRRLDDASPWVDGRLPDGTRLHAILSPLAQPGTLISLRKPSDSTLSFAELERSGSLSSKIADELRRIIDQRESFLVTGATGSGKTTVLAALLAEVNAEERIVIVEDSAELRPHHPHVVTLEGRPANVEGAGRVTMRELIRQSLRMRPDRLIVGEVRGAEVADMLMAMNTGHEGSAATVHANSPRDCLARLAALGSTAGLSSDATRTQVAAAIDVIIHVARGHDGRRRVEEIARLERGENTTLRVRTTFRYND